MSVATREQKGFLFRPHPTGAFPKEKKVSMKYKTSFLVILKVLVLLLRPAGEARGIFTEK